MRVFWLRGYEGASLSDLTGAMGINKPSLYARFNDKRGLFLAAIERYNEVVGSPKLQRIIDGKTVHETVVAYFEEINTSLTSSDTPPGCMLNSVVTDLAGRDDEMRTYISDLIEATEAFLAKRFQELGDAPMDEQALAEIIVSFGQSLAARARLGATYTELANRTNRFLPLIFRPDEPVPPD
ncbi:MAG: TetR/AcrR family transcriptional regulator [Pseudomonadota bacterium]